MSTNSNNIVFKKHNRRGCDISSAWYYFHRSDDGIYAKCQKCNKILKNSGSTSSLLKHLKLIHAIEPKTDNQPQILPSTSQNAAGEPKLKKKKTLDDFYVKDGEEDLQTVVAKLTSLDGLPFRVFCTSDTMKKLFQKCNYSLPQSSNTIRDMVVTKCGQLKNELKKEILSMKADGHIFSVTLDEWTSAKNRRYMNVNIHSPKLSIKPFRNLGLSRIRGRGTAENCYDLLREKLLQFGLSLEVDIACIVSDGASVMRALGLRSSAKSQLCLAHGIQLAVLDVLYKKESNTEPSLELLDNIDSDDSEEEDSDDDEMVLLANTRRNVPLVICKDLITKVRQIVKFFKSSPTRTDVLNTNLGSDVKHLQVILDCKTRWSSLADMITRFLQLKDAIMKTLIDLKNDTSFSAPEIEILTDISHSLNIIKATVEAICRENANLLTSETALKFMISRLSERNSTISQQLVKSLTTRILQRRQPELVGTLKYLHNPSKFYEESPCDIFKNPSNATILNVIIEILYKHFSPPDSESILPVEDDSSDDDVALVNYHQQNANYSAEISKEIDKALSNTAVTPRNYRLAEDIGTMCKVEMALFDAGGPRSKHLTQIFNLLMSIPPTSVEAERVFSSTGYLCNKLRTSLNDSTLDSLCYLRSHYQRIKK